MRELLELASTQYGVFNRRQAHTAKISNAVLRARVRSGFIQDVGHNVFRVVGAARTWRQDVMAACLGAPGLCAASHRSAAVLHGHDGFTPGVVEVVIPHGTRYRREGVRVHTTRALTFVDLTHVGPIPVTTSERTLIDLGAVCGFARVEHATDSAERDHKAGREQLVARHAALRARGRNGIATMTAVLADRGLVVPQSVLERRFFNLVVNAGLPRPTLQVKVELPNGRPAYLDAAYERLLLGFEIDGHRWHSSRAQRISDNRRAGLLADLGWDIRRFSYDEILRDPSTVVAEIRGALANRSGVSERADRAP
jgi:predicted transcriptional regulator of viral defense system